MSTNKPLLQSLWVGGPVLDEVLAGRDNNLNVIRMVAAAAVLVSHAWPIAWGAADPLFALTGSTIGHFAVAVFFGISGLLIARSFDRRRSYAHFAIARVLRLFPGLLAVLVLTVIAGAWFTRLSLQDYVTRPETWRYIPANLSLYFLQYPLPGVFESNPYGPPINGSLWTLFYEVACYGGVVVLGLLGGLRSRWLALGALVLVALFHFAGEWMTGEGGLPLWGLAVPVGLLASLSFPFMLGTFAYVWREHIRLSGWLALLLWVPVPFMAAGLLMESWIVLALVYSSLWFGFVPKGALLAYNRLGDYSYGVYIYAFPVQQAVAYLVPGVTPAANIALALPVTLVLAVLSWTLVEARALSAVGPLADLFTRGSGAKTA
ncbi:acyltransferase family protein [Porphyrobacter sp. ULC335]|uniref:acyltransferase family protein n=1 Tax=Porphyrobacter sp. ULC335 TaxID=2854260 RepID=UPI00221F92E8|nr:acyltransferase [Porphyrobacter sp. ULC335]UYV15865.1 acyltransferase [Porphyrobacter sp. ULC335]